MLLNRVGVIKSVHYDQYNVFVIICIIILSLGMCIIYNSSLSFSSICLVLVSIHVGPLL